jgi:hypothetical protein
VPSRSGTVREKVRDGYIVAAHDDADDTDGQASEGEEGEQIQPGVCGAAGTPTLSAMRVYWRENPSVLIAGKAGVACGDGAQAEGTGTIYTSRDSATLQNSVLDAVPLANSAKPCEPSAECTVTFETALRPGDPGYADPDIAQFYVGVAQFNYSPAGTAGPSQLATNIVASPD